MLDLEDSVRVRARVGERDGVQVLHEVDGRVHGRTDASGVVGDAEASAEAPRDSGDANETWQGVHTSTG